MKVSAQAPSNIALIKYMGKIDSKENRPTNTSLSYTLRHLVTTVEIEKQTDVERDQWEPLVLDSKPTMELSDKGRDRFLKHFEFLKGELGLQGSFTVRSNNNFPSDCGLASSASSFAALTLAAFLLSKGGRSENSLGDRELLHLSELSRKGSGSSCRSFFKDWSVWHSRGAEPLEVHPLLKNLEHLVVISEAEIKEVSSSQAHLRVLESPLFEGRPERAEVRAERLIQALRSADWKACYEVSWGEFWDMHALFETCPEPFGYMNGGSLEVLNQARSYWRTNGDGPIVTMDAGPNVHLLFREDQKNAYDFFKKYFSQEPSGSFEVIGSLS